MFIEQKRCSEEENQWLLDSDDSNLTSDDEGALDRYYDELYSTPESSPNTDVSKSAIVKLRRQLTMMSSDCRTISSRSTSYPPRSIDRRSFKQSRAMKCKEPKRQEGQQRRSFRDCPVPDCPSVLLPRIDKHLQQVHNYKTSSTEYHQLLSAAPDSKETEEGGKKEEEEEDFLVEMEDIPKDILDIYGTESLLLYDWKLTMYSFVDAET
ncbi:uncharacterized protein [Apostichopus japonicus]|uniref:uncharacterized protein isoform X4 n=1 Tax=Stichopus japonicus TaxID=307972 RepID=UPI003AB19600